MYIPNEISRSFPHRVIAQLTLQVHNTDYSDTQRRQFAKFKSKLQFWHDFQSIFRG